MWAYEINLALRTIRALLGSLRVVSQSWSLLAHEEKAGLMPGMMLLAQRGLIPKLFTCSCSACCDSRMLSVRRFRSARMIGGDQALVRLDLLHC